MSRAISLPALRILATLLLVAALQSRASRADATQIPITGVQVFPNERTSSNLPPDAIDGNLTTFTWSTQSGNSAAARLAVAFDSTLVNRLRLWKDDADGASLVSVNAKDLTIQYTTDTNPDLSLRSWTTVSGLTSGFLGTELINSTAVNSNGTVVADVHDSVNAGDGWASLTFNAPAATGLAILVDHTGGNTGPLHYKVHELQVHFEQSLVPEPATAVLLALPLFALSRSMRRKRATRSRVAAA